MEYKCFTNVFNEIFPTLFPFAFIFLVTPRSLNASCPMMKMKMMFCTFPSNVAAVE